ATFTTKRRRCNISIWCHSLFTQINVERGAAIVLPLSRSEDAGMRDARDDRCCEEEIEAHLAVDSRREERKDGWESEGWVVGGLKRSDKAGFPRGGSDKQISDFPLVG